jgi:hypothetical protein
MVALGELLQLPTLDSKESGTLNCSVLAVNNEAFNKGDFEHPSSVTEEGNPA